LFTITLPLVLPSISCFPRFEYLYLTPKDMREVPSARKEGNEGHKVIKDVTSF
jgi:hypothetical protein